jgi:hypothetical protein
MGKRPQAETASAKKNGRKHEQSDLSVRAVLGFFLGVALLIVTSFFLVGGLFSFFGEMSKEAAPPSPQIADVRRLPPSPRLQVSPTRELEAVRKAEEEILGSYAWVDREKGIARIPIGRAMDLVAEGKLPARGGQGPGPEGRSR